MRSVSVPFRTRGGCGQGLHPQYARAGRISRNGHWLLKLAASMVPSSPAPLPDPATGQGFKGGLRVLLPHGPHKHTLTRHGGGGSPVQHSFRRHETRGGGLHRRSATAEPRRWQVPTAPGAHKPLATLATIPRTSPVRLPSLSVPLAEPPSALTSSPSHRW